MVRGFAPAVTAGFFDLLAYCLVSARDTPRLSPRQHSCVLFTLFNLVHCVLKRVDAVISAFEFYL